MSFCEIPTSITIDNQNYSFAQLFNQFSQTQAGITLSEKTRWERYRTPETSKTEWQEIIGHDANNLRHQRLTCLNTYLFLNDMEKSQSDISFSKEEQSLLLATATTHDMPEGATKKGDVTYAHKTEDDEKEELSHMEKIFIEALGNKSQNLAQKVKNILEDKESKLGRAFNAIERIGYLRTALIAWKKRNQFTSSISEGLTWITHNVFASSFSKLLSYKDIYPPVKHYLSAKKDIISDILTNMPESVKDKYDNDPTKETALKNFNQVSEIWNSRVSLPNWLD